MKVSVFMIYLLLCRVSKTNILGLILTRDSLNDNKNMIIVVGAHYMDNKDLTFTEKDNTFTIKINPYMTRLIAYFGRGWDIED